MSLPAVQPVSQAWNVVPLTMSVSTSESFLATFLFSPSGHFSLLFIVKRKRQLVLVFMFFLNAPQIKTWIKTLFKDGKQTNKGGAKLWELSVHFPSMVWVHTCYGGDWACGYSHFLMALLSAVSVFPHANFQRDSNSSFPQLHTQWFWSPWHKNLLIHLKASLPQLPLLNPVRCHFEATAERAFPCPVWCRPFKTVQTREKAAIFFYCCASLFFYLKCFKNATIWHFQPLYSHY